MPADIGCLLLWSGSTAALLALPQAGNTKGGSITVLLTSCLTGLDWSVLQIKTKIVSCHTANSKPVRQEVNSSVIPPLIFPALGDVTFAQLVCPLNDVIFCLHQE